MMPVYTNPAEFAIKWVIWVNSIWISNFRSLSLQENETLQAFAERIDVSFHTNFMQVSVNIINV